MNIESYIKAITVPNVDKKQIGERIRSKRIAAGLRQSELADLCDVRPLTMWRYESGKQLPGTETLDKLSAQLLVSVEWILHGDQNKKNINSPILPKLESESFLIWANTIAPPDVQADELKILKELDFKNRHPGPHIYSIILTMMRAAHPLQTAQVSRITNIKAG